LVNLNLIKYKINPKYETEFKDFLLNIKEYFNQNNQTIHKARNELKIIKYNDLDTVVKSFKVPNILRRIYYTFFRDTKAKKSYEYSVKLKDFTPEPIGYIEFYTNGLLDDSYFISEKFNYDFTIREPLLDDNFQRKEEILSAFARFTYQLHEAGIFHNDYSPGNILIKQDKDNFIFKIVDVNRMKFFNLSFEDRAKNFSKLWASDIELDIIGNEYIKYAKYDGINFVKKMQEFNNKNKSIKNLKKRLKGQKVVD